MNKLLDRKKVERERKRVGKAKIISKKTENTQNECFG